MSDHIPKTRYTVRITLVLLVVFMFVLSPTLCLASSCETDGLDGQWVLVDDSMQDCGVNFMGMPSTDIGNGSFEAINNEMKMREAVKCTAGVFGGTSCGWPGGDQYEACCSYYFDNKPNLLWPPCLAGASEYLDNGESICNPAVCDEYYNGVGCGLCDSQGGMYDPTDVYGWDLIFSKQVNHRSLYQWVCNDCFDEYEMMINECGDPKDINWNNETCEGFCVDKDSNLGPEECKTDPDQY